MGQKNQRAESNWKKSEMLPIAFVFIHYWGTIHSRETVFSVIGAQDYTTVPFPLERQ